MRFRPDGRTADTRLPSASGSLPTHRSGFTLIELLIVVLILGLVAAIAIPQISGSTGDAKQAALDTNLSLLREAVELYALQHGGVYPGAKHHVTGANTTTSAQARESFVAQMTLYTSRGGVSATRKDEISKYGPYLKAGIPPNPYSSLNTVMCDIATKDISSVSSDGSTGWKFYVKTGRLIGNHTGVHGGTEQAQLDGG